MANRTSWKTLAAVMTFSGLNGVASPLAEAQFATNPGNIAALAREFAQPPASSTPGVYWYFMDGNFSREGVTRDLESMKEAGISRVVFLEVNVGVPRGKVLFRSPEWLELFAFVVSESKRLGIEITLGVGPGWAGSGGPWVKPEDSMPHLVASETTVTADQQGPVKLPVPPPRKPYFGEEGLTPEFKQQWESYYADVAVLAYPTSSGAKKVSDIDNKALYYREPYTSKPGVPPYLEMDAAADAGTSGPAIAREKVLNLSGKMDKDGTLNWKPESGEWTVLRFGTRNNGAITRPAPAPGIGMEVDKMNTAALSRHLENFTGKIFKQVGDIAADTPGGLKMLHMDSWEMGAQNWTPGMREEFRKRRGYDPTPYFPAYLGYVVETPEISERFLWDLRLTCQELVFENHVDALKEYGRKYGMGLSIEPYDMNPTSDLALGSLADIPMCEFWSAGYGFDSAFTCLEATSIAHVKGRRFVQAEAFTGDPGENWNQYPGSMKNQGDWAFALGINRFFYHTFAHQALDESLAPGMTMGPYGVHWDRKQTWWPMVGAYHRYVSRCQHLLQHGQAVSDILYVIAEGAPHVFVAPPTALAGAGVLPDKRGYSFDGCAPGDFMNANVENGQVVFPGGGSYRIVVLPVVKEMSPAFLKKVLYLLEAGATIAGVRPNQACGLSGYPQSDAEVKALADKIWGAGAASTDLQERAVGKGRLVTAPSLAVRDGKSLFPPYDPVASILRKQVTEDFSSTAPLRYHHRKLSDSEMYFVSNTADERVQADCTFRCDMGAPEIWGPLAGDIRPLPIYKQANGATTVPLQFFPHQSYFVVFRKSPREQSDGVNFNEVRKRETLEGPWTVSFDPKWGGPASVQFDQLVDWTTRPEEGIRYYSGSATYKKEFNFRGTSNADEGPLYLDLGEVKHLARVRLNGKDLGVVWTHPWRVDIAPHVRVGTNQLEINVANLWPNRMIGDKKYENDGIRDGKWPDWMATGQRPKTNRFTFTTYDPFKPDTKLIPSGLIGPITLQW